MATIVEQPAAARTEGLPGLQPIVTGLPGNLPAVQAGYGKPGREPSAGDAAGSQIGDTRLAETGAAGKGGSPGEVGVGNLGGPASGMGGSVAVAAAGGGGRVGRVIGTATQGGVGTAVAIHDGPQLTGPEGGGGGQATSSESSVGEREGQAASGRAYAGRQQVGTPGGSLTGDVEAAGGPAGHAGLGQLGSLLGATTGTARSLPGRGTAPGSSGSGVGVDASSPAGAPDVSGPLGPAIAAMQGREDSPGAAVGGPGVLAGPMTSPAGSGSGRGEALGMDQGAVGPAVGVAMGGMGSDAAVETADVVLMTDSPLKMAEAVSIAKSTRRIVWQNIFLAFTIKAVFILFGAMGMASMWEAVFADMGTALAAVINSTRIIGVDTKKLI